MSDRNASPEAVIALIVVLVVGGAVLRLSMALGADFLPTLASVGWSALVVVGTVAWLWFRDGYGPANWLARVVGVAAAIWPGWWRTLDSIAANGGRPHPLFPANPGIIGYPSADRLPFDQDVWWTAWWFDGVTELMLVGLFLGALAWGARRWRY